MYLQNINYVKKGWLLKKVTDKVGHYYYIMLYTDLHHHVWLLINIGIFMLQVLNYLLNLEVSRYLVIYY